MHVRRLALLAVAVPVVCLPATADAKLAPLRGQVIAAPYVSGSNSAISVLLSKQSARKAHLSSPVGILLIKRSHGVATPAGKIKPGNLRVGDKFRSKARIYKRTRKAAFPTLKTSSLTVTKRSKVLSNDELTTQIGDLTNRLNALSGFVGQLTGYTVSQIASLRADLNGVKTDLAGLKSQLASLSATLAQVQVALGGLNNLPAGLVDTVNGLVTDVGSLGTTVTGLSGTVTGLTGDVGTLTSGLANVSGLLTGITPGQLATALTAITTLQTAVAGLDVPAITSAISGLQTKIGAVGGTDLQTQLNSLSTTLGGLQTTLTTATGQLSFLCSGNLVSNPLGGALGNLTALLGLTNLGSCPS